MHHHVRRLIGAGLFLGLAGGLLTTSVSAATIERVEPPSWWTGFQHSELQILVYGKDIGSFTPSVERGGVSITRVERVASDNYLFLYLEIDADTRPGSFDIVFENGVERLAGTYELRKKIDDAEHVTGFSSADAIYLITPDRFANGDPTNDAISGFDDPPDRSEPFGRHGGDLAGMMEHLDYIRDMGFTAVWLNPILENAMPESSYHGYATTDFYAVDPRFGSNQQYRDFVAKAKSKRLGVIMDMIVNHIGSEHWWMDDLPTSDWLNFQRAYTQTSHARTTNQDPYASEFDKALFADGWFVEKMPDLNQRNPLMADYLIQNAIWWIEYLGLAGIRMDTYPYPDKAFMSEWTRRIMQEYPDFTVTGEEWSPNPAIVSYWQRGKENHDGYVSSLPSVLDFPLQIAFRKSLLAEEPGWGSVWTPAYEMLGNDFLYPDPGKLVIFPDNHDMSRIYTQLNEDYDLFRMAIVYYLTMRGIPAIYYGTEILMSHPGTESHGDIRSDFPGGWAGSRKNGFTSQGLGDRELQAQSFMKQLLNWRKDKTVIHSGRLMQFAPIRNVYAYFRYNDADTVMVILNRGQDTETLDLDRFAERMGDTRVASDVISGRRYNLDGSIVLEPRSVLLLESANR